MTAKQPRNVLTIVAAIFVAVELAVVLFPLLAVPDDGAAHFIDPFQLAALFAWSVAVAIGLPTILISIFGVLDARRSGARRFAVVTLIAALAITLTPVIIVVTWLT